MKSSTLLFVLLLSLSTLAQRKSLYGSWQSDSIMVSQVGDSTISIYSHNTPFIITFNKRSGNIHEISSINSLNKVAYEENKIKYKHNKFILKNRKYIKGLTIEDGSGLMQNDFSTVFVDYEIKSDSTLIIKEEMMDCEYQELIKGECYLAFRLKRVPTQSYTSLSEIKKQSEIKLNNVLSRKLILKKQNSSVVESLKVGSELKISVESKDVCTSNREEVNYYVDAIGVPKNDSTIIVHCTRIKSSFYGNDGYTYTKDKYDAGYNLNSKMLEINKSNVTSISYYSPKHYKINQKSNTVAWLAFVSAIVVAPMASINFKEKSFNRNRYFKILGVSSGLMAVSITIALNTNGKSYFLGDRYGNGGWDIE